MLYVSPLWRSGSRVDGAHRVTTLAAKRRFWRALLLLATLSGTSFTLYADLPLRQECCCGPGATACPRDAGSGHGHSCGAKAAHSHQARSAHGDPRLSVPSPCQGDCTVVLTCVRAFAADLEVRSRFSQVQATGASKAQGQRAIRRILWQRAIFGRGPPA
jgi:hypothetical protein